MRFFILSLFLCFLTNNSTFAHSGRTNSEGCHNNRSNGTYHCHGKKSYSNKNNTYKNSKESESFYCTKIDGDEKVFNLKCRKY